MTSPYDAYRTIQDQLIKVQRDTRKVMESRRAELAVAGIEREIAIWQQIHDAVNESPVDFNRVIDLLLQAEMLEQAKKRNFYL